MGENPTEDELGDGGALQLQLWLWWSAHAAGAHGALSAGNHGVVHAALWDQPKGAKAVLACFNIYTL